MTAARPIPNLEAGDSYATAAVKILDVRVSEVFDHADGVLDMGDIERVHDMRVATRRLRATLEIFESCFPRKELKAVLREVRTLADALGERRDRDVSIASIEQVRASAVASDRIGIDSFIGRLRAEQAAANEELARFVAPERLATLREQLSGLLDKARSRSVERETGSREDEQLVALPEREPEVVTQQHVAEDVA